MSSNLTGKVTLVTGSTAGIGHGIAHVLARGGASVILTGLIEETAIPVLLSQFQGCSDYTGNVHFLPSDFTEFDNVEAFSQKVLGLYPEGIDILVNNAGVPGADLIENFSTKVWKDTVAINLNAPFILTRAFFPLMKTKGWGRIINMSARLGQVGMVGKLAYCSTKSALVVALEGAMFGVMCNAICPGYVDAPICHGIIQNLAEEKGISFEECKKEFLKDRTPIGGLISISEIVELVAFLCSGAPSSITGSPILIDGGFVAR